MLAVGPLRDFWTRSTNKVGRPSINLDFQRELLLSYNDSIMCFSFVECRIYFSNFYETSLVDLSATSNPRVSIHLSGNHIYLYLNLVLIDSDKDILFVSF